MPTPAHAYRGRSLVPLHVVVLTCIVKSSSVGESGGRTVVQSASLSHVGTQRNHFASSDRYDMVI